MLSSSRIARAANIICTTFVVHVSGIHIHLRGGGHFQTRLWARLRSQFCDVLAYVIFGPFVEAISPMSSELGAQIGSNSSYSSSMSHGHTKPKGKVLGFVGMGAEVSVN